jgi:hypothetical protein
MMHKNIGGTGLRATPPPNLIALPLFPQKGWVSEGLAAMDFFGR